MTVNFHADPTRLAIWTGLDDAPLDDPAGLSNIDRVRFHTDFDYIGFTEKHVVNKDFTVLKPGQFNDWSEYPLLTHGKNGIPLVMVWYELTGASQINSAFYTNKGPVVGSVPVYLFDDSASDVAGTCSFLSIKADASHVILNVLSGASSLFGNHVQINANFHIWVSDKVK